MADPTQAGRVAEALKAEGYSPYETFEFAANVFRVFTTTPDPNNGPAVLVHCWRRHERLRGVYVEVAGEHLGETVERLVARLQVARLPGPSVEDLEREADAEEAELAAFSEVEEDARNLLGICEEDARNLLGICEEEPGVRRLPALDDLRGSLARLDAARAARGDVAQGCACRAAACFYPDCGAESETDDVTSRWAKARKSGTGWLDLRPVVPVEHRPACGAKDCGDPADWLDEAGVGWCDTDVPLSLFPQPSDWLEGHAEVDGPTPEDGHRV